jgi:hypothetical protein
VRSLAACCAAAVSVLLGLALIAFYIDGHIGGVTTLLAGFSIGAVSFTAVVFREGAGPDPDDEVVD